MEKQVKILCPTDFSDTASNAFRYALLLADALRAEVQLVHVVYPQTESLDLPVITAEATLANVEMAKETMKAFSELGFTQLAWQLINAPKVSSEVLIGNPVPTITRAVEEEHFDLIIMGTRGEHKGLDKLLGSVASGVVSKATCPVMVVPAQAPFKKPQHIAYATDISDSDPLAIWKMIQLLKPFQPHIHCVHFSMKGEMSENEEKVEQMKGFLLDRFSPVKVTFHHLPGTKLEDDLNLFIEDQDIDLLVMFQPKRSIWERFFHRSSVRKIAINTRVPLLVQKVIT